MYVPNHPKNKTIFKRPEIPRTNRGRSETCRKGLPAYLRKVHADKAGNRFADPGNTMLPGSGDSAGAALHDTALSHLPLFSANFELGE